jgi:hypothetical protein
MGRGKWLTPARVNENEEDVRVLKGKRYVVMNDRGYLQERVGSSRVYAEGIRSSKRHCRFRLLLSGGGRAVAILGSELML